MAPPLRQVYDQMLEPKWVIAMGACASSGGMFNNYTILQGVDKIVPVDVHVPGARRGPRRSWRASSACTRRSAPASRPHTRSAGSRSERDALAGVPGVVETQEAHGETTLVVDPARLVEACLHLRDEAGFNFLSDIAPSDYLGWGEKGVAGYVGTADGRDLNQPGSQGYARVPDPKPKRFAVTYQLLRVSRRPRPAHGQGLARRGRGRSTACSPSGRRPTGSSARPGT